MVDVGEGARRTPNVRATLLEIHEGLVASSVNCWPSVSADLGAINDWFSPLLPSGFYYKTFKWPNWHVFEPAIRRMAGLGRASGLADPDRYRGSQCGGGCRGRRRRHRGAERGRGGRGSRRRYLVDREQPRAGQVLAWHADAHVKALVEKVGRLGVRVLRRSWLSVYTITIWSARSSRCRRRRIATGETGGFCVSGFGRSRARAAVAAAGAFRAPAALSTAGGHACGCRR